jgi:scyllo-inositol 2-dehydrogenase (NADP+)
MTNKRVALVGCGNITSTRHIPALRRLGGVEIVGVVGVIDERVAAAARAVRRFAAPGGARQFVGDVAKGDIPEWLSQTDLIIVGTPPSTHAGIAVRLAEGAPHSVLLMEKPLVVTTQDRAEMVALADRDPAILVMHNFQFARGFRKVIRWINQGSIGEIRSIQAYQWSTKARRLPTWYQELPLGLFWDEAAHFLYLTEALVGKMRVESASAFRGKDPADPTPSVLTAMLVSSTGVPVEIAMHFDAGISEWGVVVSGTAGTVVYDLFRDIAVRLPYDGIHLGRQVLTTSLTSTFQHWTGVVANGTRRVTGNLHYGIDQVLGRALDVVSGSPVDPRVSVDAGLRATDLMRDIVQLTGERS